MDTYIHPTIKNHSLNESQSIANVRLSPTIRISTLWCPSKFYMHQSSPKSWISWRRRASVFGSGHRWLGSMFGPTNWMGRTSGSFRMVNPSLWERFFQRGGQWWKDTQFSYPTNPQITWTESTGLGDGKLHGEGVLILPADPWISTLS